MSPTTGKKMGLIQKCCLLLQIHGFEVLFRTDSGPERLWFVDASSCYEKETPKTGFAIQNVKQATEAVALLSEKSQSFAGLVAYIKRGQKGPLMNMDWETCSPGRIRLRQCHQSYKGSVKDNKGWKLKGDL